MPSESGISRRNFLAVTSIAAATAFMPGFRDPRREEDELVDIANLPHAELHRHLEAGISPESIARLATKNNVVEATSRTGKPIEGLDLQDPDSIRGYYARIARTDFKTREGFSAFLESLGVGLSPIKSLEDMEEIAYSQALDQAAAGNIHTEFRGSPYTYVEKIPDANMVDVIKAIRAGLRRAYSERGVSSAYIACCSRQKVPQFGNQVVEAVLNLFDRDDPIGLDIAGGPEQDWPPAKFADTLRPAVEAGVPITIHGGEQSKHPQFEETPADPYVLEAITKCGARRIGHGTSLMADRRLRDLVRERGIHIEACPSSNAALGYVSMADHPMKLFLEEGLSVGANTDDAYVFGVASVRDMLVKNRVALGIGANEVRAMTKNSVEAAFISDSRKRALLGDLATR